MVSKRLGDLMISVPPATAAGDVRETPASPPLVAQAPVAKAPVASPASPVPPETSLAAPGQGRAVPEKDVPLQFLLPPAIRRQLAVRCTDRGESLRSVMLQAIRAIGIEVSDEEITGKRSRKNY